MNLEYNNLLKNFQSAIISYQDISAIYSKLFAQGQVQKLAALFNEIYDEEHVFTLNELQKYCRENGQNEDEFVSEQYELNSNIFRRNLTLIVQNLVEEVGKNFLEKFKIEYSSRNAIEKEVQEEEEDQQAPEQSYEKAQYKSNMPEIEEETEPSPVAKTANSASHSRVKTHENESDQTASSYNKFDLNIQDLSKKIPTQPSQGQLSQHNTSSPYNSSPSYEQKAQSQIHYQQQQQQNYHLQQQQQQYYQQQQQLQQEYRQSSGRNVEEQPRRNYQTEPNRDDDGYVQTASFVKNEERINSEHYPNNNNRYENFAQYDDESTNYRANLQKYYKQSAKPRSTPFESANNTHATNTQNQYWSSPERTNNHAKRSITDSNSGYKKAVSPGRTEGSTNSNSFMNRSATRWSGINDRPDPSVLDSEFSYGGGKSFTRSPKQFHYNIQNVPGPGHYEMEESKKIVRSVTPDISFPKSPKVPSYFTKSNVPGPIYYPIKHFSSK